LRAFSKALDDSKESCTIFAMMEVSKPKVVDSKKKAKKTN
jgi:hypothetical protein